MGETSRQEWVLLGLLRQLDTESCLVAVKAALKCRRVVQVLMTDSGAMGYYARVPLPKKVAALIAPPSPQSSTHGIEDNG